MGGVLTARPRVSAGALTRRGGNRTEFVLKGQTKAEPCRSSWGSGGTIDTMGAGGQELPVSETLSTIFLTVDTRGK